MKEYVIRGSVTMDEQDCASVTRLVICGAELTVAALNTEFTASSPDDVDQKLKKVV